jgi:hypothetical protein
LDPATLQADYAAYLFQPFFTWAGSIPASKVGVDPASGADRYLSDLIPQSAFGAGETNLFGAAYVSAMPLQHAYSGAMDLDLSPRLRPPGTTQGYESDGFVALNSPGFNPGINVNNQGFKEEDFNYAHVASVWVNTRAVDGSMEYTQDAQNGLIFWGNTSVKPNHNYSVQSSESLDGTDFTLARDDELFHPHRGTTLLPDLATHSTVTHYRVMSSIGAAILAAPISAASVKPAKLKRGQPENPLDPELQPSISPVSRNLYYQMRTGFLGTQWSSP